MEELERVSRVEAVKRITLVLAIPFLAIIVWIGGSVAIINWGTWVAWAGAILACLALFGIWKVSRK